MPRRSPFRTVEPVPEFLAEVYVSAVPGAPGLPPLDDVRRAAATVAGAQPVELLRQISVPDEETCFYLFEAPSADLVLDAASRCGLRIDSIVAAVSGQVPPTTPWSSRPSRRSVRPSVQEEA